MTFYLIILCHIPEVLPTLRPSLASGGGTRRFISTSGLLTGTINITSPAVPVGISISQMSLGTRSGACGFAVKKVETTYVQHEDVR